MESELGWPVMGRINTKDDERNLYAIGTHEQESKQSLLYPGLILVTISTTESTYLKFFLFGFNLVYSFYTNSLWTENNRQLTWTIAHFHNES